MHSLVHAQARRLEAEVGRLQAQAQAPAKDAPSRLTLAKLHTELKLKDERLRQLRAAIKTLETNLADLLKEKTDL